MRLLAIDTATEALSAALWLDGEIIERHAVVNREHAARLPLLVPELIAAAGLSLQQLDGLVCGIGPGSFAGVRIGVSYVKGLALGLDLPVIGVTSLAMLAQAALADAPDALALAAIDARMNEVYFGAYRQIDGQLTALQDEIVSPPEAVAVAMAADTRCVAVGSGWGVHGEALRAAIPAVGASSSCEAGAFPHAAAALAIAAPAFASGGGGDAAALVPAYLRNRVALTQAELRAARA